LADASDWHIDSVFDPQTKQIYSNTVVCIHNSLSLNEECNSTGTPKETTPTTEGDDTPDQNGISFILKDNDSDSTF
jgi:hypothetical protein